MKSTNQIDKSEINELVELTGQGDWEAFKKLKDKMYPILFKFLRRYCFDDELIKDIISSTFCIIIEKSNKKMLYFMKFRRESYEKIRLIFIMYDGGSIC